MYKILVVDDEKFVREGIKFLIHKHQLELKIAEAENGEKALAYIQENQVDILFTDIKMPFMDGLELSEKAREVIPDIKIIIFSAYSEFEYARKAITLDVFHYILKPFEVDEFLKVISDVMKLCDKERQEKAEAERMLEAYNKSIVYEKEKVLMDAINGIGTDESLGQRMTSAGIDLGNKKLQLVMLDFKARFFDIRNEEFKELIKQLATWEYEYLNLNERQSLLFILGSQNGVDRGTISAFGEALITQVKHQYRMDLCIAISDTICSPDDIGRHYESIEQILDYKFFFDDSVILFADENSNSIVSSLNIENVLDNINKYITESSDYEILKSLDPLFNNFADKGSFSAIYVKYMCSEIVKKIYEKAENKGSELFKQSLDKIFKSESLAELKEIIKEAVQESKLFNVEPDSCEANKRVIRSVMNIIEESYMDEISLEYIAEKVFLSPQYLSFLFKRETGQSLIKYLTVYRLEKAKSLLEDTNMKIVDIAQKTGYSNTSYFIKTFKSYYGISPAKYREKD